MREEEKNPHIDQKRALEDAELVGFPWNKGCRADLPHGGANVPREERSIIGINYRQGGKKDRPHEGAKSPHEEIKIPSEELGRWPSPIGLGKEFYRTKRVLSIEEVLFLRDLTGRAPIRPPLLRIKQRVLPGAGNPQRFRQKGLLGDLRGRVNSGPYTGIPL